MSDESDRKLGERLAHLEAEMKELRQDVHAINVALNGPPRGESFRGRLHALETSNAAAKAAEAALTATRNLSRETWTISQKTALFIVALAGVGVSFYNTIGG